MAAEARDAATALQRACLEEYGIILAVVNRVLGDIEEAEDVVQTAVERALVSWPQRGIPSRPGAWLTTVARRIALDRLRSRARSARAVERLADAALVREDSESEYDTLRDWPDERLGLFWLCCDPRLTAADRAALTLREVAGYDVDRIATLFLVSPAAMTGRLTRARTRLRGLRPPDSHDLAARTARIPDILQVLYLLYTLDPEEAIRLVELLLTRLRIELIGSAREAVGLLALMELDHARDAARTGRDGEQVLLSEQDRSVWNRELIDRALARLESLSPATDPGVYETQARIQAIHALATASDDTNWQEIDRLYQRLYQRTGSPVVALNGVVAMGMWRGADAAIRALGTLREASGATLERYFYFHVAHAHFLEETDDIEAAHIALRRARELAASDRERDFIDRRIERGTRARAITRESV